MVSEFLSWLLEVIEKPIFFQKLKLLEEELTLLLYIYYWLLFYSNKEDI